jgi:tetratricopeptide (TPR) repeat protein
MLRAGERLRDPQITAIAHQNLSLCWLRLGDFDQAREHAQGALDSHLLAENWFGMVQTALNAITLEIEAGNLDEAQELLEPLDEPITQEGYPGLQATLAGLKGLLSAKRQDLPTAETHYREAFAHSRRARDPEKIVVSLQNIGLVIMEQGDPLGGLTWLRKALTKIGELDQVLREEELHRAIATALYQADRWTEAIEHLAVAQDMARKRKDFHAAAEAEADRGAILIPLGRLKQARQVLRRALQRFERWGDASWQAKIFRNLLVVSRKLNDEPEAQRYGEAALEVLAQEQWEDRADIQRMLAEGSLRQHLEDQAVRRFGDEIAEVESKERTTASRRRETAWRSLTAGALLRDYGHPESSLGFYSRAIRLYSGLGDSQLLFHSRNGRAIALIEMSEFTKARNDLRRCLDLADDHSDRAMEQEATFNLGELERRRGSPSKAMQFFERSTELAGELGDVVAEAETHVAKGLVLEDMENYASARASFVTAQKLAADARATMPEARALAGSARNLFILGRHKEAARLYKRAAKLSSQDGGTHHAEILSGVVESLAAGGSRKSEIDAAAQVLIDAAQSEGLEATASVGLARSARWLITSRRSLAVELFVAAIMIEVAAASHRLETKEDFERFAGAVMRPTMLLALYANEVGESELLLADVAKSIQHDYPELLKTFEQALDEARAWASVNPIS